MTYGPGAWIVELTSLGAPLSRGLVQDVLERTFERVVPERVCLDAPRIARFVVVASTPFVLHPFSKSGQIAWTGIRELAFPFSPTLERLENFAFQAGKPYDLRMLVSTTSRDQVREALRREGFTVVGPVVLLATVVRPAGSFRSLSDVVVRVVPHRSADGIRSGILEAAHASAE